MKSRLLIGIITTNCHTEYQGDILRGMISQAFKSSCDVSVICPLTSFQIETKHQYNEKNIFSLILSDVFDGFLYDRNSFHNEKIQKYIDKLCTSSSKPVMLLDYNDHNRFETTMADDMDIFEQMTDHLIEVHGCKKIYCLTGTKGTLSAEERLRGYLRSMKKHDLPIDRSYYTYGDFWHTSANEFAQKILNDKSGIPDAVVCGNDIMAVTLSEKLIKGGLRVPEDIAVTGFDASMDGYRANPSITSCKRPNFQLGAEAFRRLYRIITGKICSKVPDEPSKIRLGKSCGCTEDPLLKSRIMRKIKKNNLFQNKLFCSDMMIDITNAYDISNLIDKIDHYTYLIYKMSQIFICTTEKYEAVINGTKDCKLDFNESDPVNIVFNKSAICRNPAAVKCNSSGEAINLFRQNRKQASAFYISPLHYNDNFFGFSAVSFGKLPIAYSDVYLQWINYINIAFEKVRIQSVMKLSLKKLDTMAIYDNITGLLSPNGFSEIFNKRLSEINSESTKITYVHIELTELKNFYHKNGNDKTKMLLKNFSDILKTSLIGTDICGTVAPGCFGIVSFNSNRAELIFDELKHSIINLKASSDNDFFAFTIGSYTCEFSEKISLTDMIYKASVNIIHTYSKKETISNPQFEKLCDLRNRMKKNPEYQWNISDIADNIFISKSYLQKIYKLYFSKSIIEELIQFRLEKAKKMLIETDQTVSDIAMKCGYTTYNYFVRQFRTFENVSPSQYRKLNKKK